MFLEPILEQPITSEHRTTAPSLTFGNVRRSGPTPTGSGKIVLYPTNELPISKAAPKSCGQKYQQVSRAAVASRTALNVCSGYHSRQGGASCRSSDVRDAPLATVGPKKAACRDGPNSEIRLGLTCAG